MNADSKSQAVATGSDRIDQIIHWSKRRSIITIACAVVLIIACGYSLFEYAPIVARSLTESTNKSKAALRAEEATEQALKKDRKAIIQKAVDSMRESAARIFGTTEANPAQINADEAGIRDLGGEKWEVTGLYVGAPDKGVKFRAPWTASISVKFGALQCGSIGLGQRTPTHPVGA
jgi:hypothetical protein